MTPSDLKAVHFGAGNIGRGFLGQLYSESGYDTVFIEALPDVVAALNQAGRYPIHIAEAEPSQVWVERVSAIHSSDTDRVSDAVATADIVSTAVGVSALEQLAPAIAEGLVKRWKSSGRPLDILICENLIHAGPYLRERIANALPDDLLGDLAKKVGFVEASIGRMVPRVPESLKAENPLVVVVEAYCELPVDAEAFRGDIPDIVGLKPLRPFEAYVERKLYIHNAGHAVAAYLGWLAGAKTIDEAMGQPAIATVVEASMMESAVALRQRHELPMDGLRDHVQDLLRRFKNAALGDQVVRVGADPLRKLGPEDRLMGAVRICVEQELEARHLAIGVRSALAFAEKTDPQAMALQRRIETDGLPEVVRSLAPTPEVADYLLSQMQ